jgi:hypothetical protein
MPAPRRNDQYTAYRGRAMPAASTRARRAKSVPRTESGRLLPQGVAVKVAEGLDKLSEGQVASVVETSKDTAQSWKLGRRAPNSSYLLALGRNIDEVGMLIAEEIDAGRFYGHDSRYRQILQQHAIHETPEGRFARQILRELEN